MDDPELNTSPDLTPSHIIDGYLTRLQNEVHTLLSNEIKTRQDNNELATELSAFKKAYSSSEKDKKDLEEKNEKLRQDKKDLEEKLEKLRQEMEQDRHEMENQSRGSRVVCLIDGDGSIFSDKLIAEGQAGGHLAAKMLSEATAQYLSSNCSINQFQLWVYVFFNKRGLLETFGRAGLQVPKASLDDFMMGFNQGAERFLMVDVGNEKEAADAKIKAHLDDDIRLPQTLKVVFGGCHDNGYVTTLRSLITAGFCDKLILLRGYSDMAAGIDELTLPSITVPDLFRQQKIVTASCAPIGYGPFKGLELGGLSQVTTNSFKSSAATIAPIPNSGTGTNTNVNGKTIHPTHPPMPRSSLASTYSTVLQTGCISDNRPATPDLDCTDGRSLPTAKSSPVAQMRHVNSNIPLSKHKPPPCTLHYLSYCKHDADCKYGHNYILQPEHLEEMRINAKKAPCPFINKGEICPWGEKCCYGHRCPNGSRCSFLKQNRCKFTGEDMHKDA